MNAQPLSLEMKMAEFVVLSAPELRFTTTVITKGSGASKVISAYIVDCTYPKFADTFSQSCASTCQFGFFKNIA